MNGEGESSNATNIFKTTCQRPTSGQNSVPYAFFSSEKSVHRKDIRIGVNLWDLHEEVIGLNDEIASFDMHQNKKLIYLCTRSGLLLRAQLFKLGNSTSEEEVDRNDIFMCDEDILKVKESEFSLKVKKE